MEQYVTYQDLILLCTFLVAFATFILQMSRKK